MIGERRGRGKGDRTVWEILPAKAPQQSFMAVPGGAPSEVVR